MRYRLYLIGLCLVLCVSIALVYSRFNAGISPLNAIQKPSIISIVEDKTVDSMIDKVSDEVKDVVTKLRSDALEAGLQQETEFFDELSNSGVKAALEKFESSTKVNEWEPPRVDSGEIANPTNSESGKVENSERDLSSIRSEIDAINR